MDLLFILSFLLCIYEFGIINGDVDIFFLVIGKIFKICLLVKLFLFNI